MATYQGSSEVAVCRNLLVQLYPRARSRWFFGQPLHRLNSYQTLSECTLLETSSWYNWSINMSFLLLNRLQVYALRDDDEKLDTRNLSVVVFTGLSRRLTANNTFNVLQSFRSCVRKREGGGWISRHVPRFVHVWESREGGVGKPFSLSLQWMWVSAHLRHFLHQ